MNQMGVAHRSEKPIDVVACRVERNFEIVLFIVQVEIDLVVSLLVFAIVRLEGTRKSQSIGKETRQWIEDLCATDRYSNEECNHLHMAAFDGNMNRTFQHVGQIFVRQGRGPLPGRMFTNGLISSTTVGESRIGQFDVSCA